jgi:formylglycine-generating enzyme required for sulfatase activity
MLYNKMLFAGLLILSSLCLQAEDDHHRANRVTNSLGMGFVEIPAGTFTMGTADLEEAVLERPDAKLGMIEDESPSHIVTITQNFYTAETEVTQGQWLQVMQTQPGPEKYWRDPQWQQLPVVSVRWVDAQRFIEKLNQQDRQYNYRLLTEAEWEYVARAGSNELRPMPVEDLNDYAWTITNSSDKQQPVATLKPNELGVYDIYGNVWEWVNDRYAPDTYSKTDHIDPQGPDTGNKRVRRGGSYHCPTHMVRPGYRAADTADTRYSVIGFRLVAEPQS